MFQLVNLKENLHLRKVQKIENMRWNYGVGLFEGNSFTERILIEFIELICDLQSLANFKYSIRIRSKNQIFEKSL